ncbi:hypothetical protein D3C81_1141490 [compost metagenome]
MSVRRQHRLQGGQFVGDEARYFLQVAAFHFHQQIVRAGHQKYRFDLGKQVYPLRDRLKAAPSFGRNLHFDQRRDLLVIQLAGIHHRRVFDDHMVLFQFPDRFRHFFRRHA